MFASALMLFRREWGFTTRSGQTSWAGHQDAPPWLAGRCDLVPLDGSIALAGPCESVPAVPPAGLDVVRVPQVVPGQSNRLSALQQHLQSLASSPSLFPLRALVVAGSGARLGSGDDATQKHEVWRGASSTVGTAPADRPWLRGGLLHAALTTSQDETPGQRSKTQLVLRKLFDCIDADSSGFLTVRELEAFSRQELLAPHSEQARRFCQLLQECGVTSVMQRFVGLMLLQRFL